MKLECLRSCASALQRAIIIIIRFSEVYDAPVESRSSHVVERRRCCPSTMASTSVHVCPPMTHQRRERAKWPRIIWRRVQLWLTRSKVRIMRYLRQNPWRRLVDGHRAPLSSQIEWPPFRVTCGGPHVKGDQLTSLKWSWSKKVDRISAVRGTY